MTSTNIITLLLLRFLFFFCFLFSFPLKNLSESSNRNIILLCSLPLLFFLPSHHLPPTTDRLCYGAISPRAQGLRKQKINHHFFVLFCFCFLFLLLIGLCFLFLVQFHAIGSPGRETILHEFIISDRKRL